MNKRTFLKWLAVLFFITTTTTFCYGQEVPSHDSIILIKNVNIWDGTSDNLKNDQQVLIENHLIKTIGATVSVPAGAEIIDGQGGTLIPGLIDAHLHLMITDANTSNIYNNYEWSYMGARATVSARNFLMQGITTVRDMGGPVIGLKKAIDEGTVIGPRIYPSGAPLSQTAGHGDMSNLNTIDPQWIGGMTDLFHILGWFYVVDGVPEVLNATREDLKRGATQIKMMAGGGVISRYDPIDVTEFTEDEMRACVEAAQDWGTYVAVHAYTSRSVQRALQAGVISIEHGQLIDEATMKMIKEKGAFLDPQANFIMMDASQSPSPEKFKEVQSGVENEMALAKKYNVKLAFGTDVFGPLGIEKNEMNEFIARTKWYTPVEVLKQATSINASLLAMCGKRNPYQDGALGVIKEGAYADLLIYDGNPLTDINVIANFKQHLKFIMKNGKIYKDELYTLQGKQKHGKPAIAPSSQGHL